MASLRRLPTSSNWIACFMGSTGKRYQRSTGVRADGTMATRRQAQRIAEEYEDLARRKKTVLQIQKVLSDLYEEVSGESLPDSTAEDFATKWLERKQAEVRPHTLVFYKIKVEAFLKFSGVKASRALREFTPEDIRRWRDHEAKRLTPATANHGLKCIRMFFSAAKKLKMIADDPTAGIPILKKDPQPARRPFTLVELRTVLKIAPPEWRSLILFGLYTGQRLGDLATLKWEQIDIKNKEILLTTRKTLRHQKIPICSPLLSHIKSLPKPSTQVEPVHPKAESIFVSQGRSGMLSRQFYELLAKAGLVAKKSHHHKGKSGGRSARHTLSRITFHSLRHTTTSLLKNAGVSPSIAEEFVGHDSSEMNRVYTHIDQHAMRTAADKLPHLI